MLLNGKLVVNKHPSDVKDGDWIDATNIIISEDNIIQTEPSWNISDINDTLHDWYPTGYEIIHIQQCGSNEAIIFIIPDVFKRNIINIYKLTDVLKQLNVYISTDYAGGEFVSDYQIVINKLVLTFAEFNSKNGIEQPCKLIHFDNEVNNTVCQYLNPKVKLPIVIGNCVKGNAYKGWYFVFIRYKIKHNNYTKWYNTNCSNLLDETYESEINHYINIDEKYDGTFTTKINHFNMSKEPDICNLTLEYNLDNLDYNYNDYQLGFVISSRTYTKYFITEDIKISQTKFLLNKYNIREHEGNFIEDFINYYDVKALNFYKNKTYIANYKEHNNIDINLLKQIKLTTTVKENIIKHNDNISYKNASIITYKFHIRNRNSEYTYNYKIYTDWLGRKYIKVVSKEQPNLYIYYKLQNKNNLTSSGIISLNVNDAVSEFDINKYELIYYIDPIKEINSDVPRGTKQDPITSYYLKDINKEDSTSLISFKDSERGLARIFYNNNGKINLSYYIPLTHLDVITSKDFSNDSTIIFNNRDILNQTIFNSCGCFPNQYYNMYIHFVDEHGISTDGYNIVDCEISDISSLKHYLVFDNDRKLIQFKVTDGTIELNNSAIAKSNKYYTIDFNVDMSILKSKGYIGYYFSYEKFENKIANSGFHRAGYNRLYNMEYDYKDRINLDYDTIIREKYKIGQQFSGVFGGTKKITKYNGNDLTLLNDNVENIDNNNKTLILRAADSFENISCSTNIEFASDDLDDVSNAYIYLYHYDFIKDYNKLYNKKIKQLIPCSPISYTNQVEVNTKNCFLSSENCLIFEALYLTELRGILYNDAMFSYNYQVDNANSIDNKIKEIEDLNKYINLYSTSDLKEIPNEYTYYNNKPDIIFFPIIGLNSTKPGDKRFVTGNALVPRDSIDLLKERHFVIGECYPMPLQNYIEQNHVEEFPKTIRRSKIIQDESNIINNRFFPLNDYKNIIENKGEIIKLTAIGNIIIIHTIESLFMFNSSDSLKGNSERVQLADTDIWDISYKEVLTTEDASAGITRQEHAIVGQFGYIFYDKLHHHIYRLDGQQLAVIDDDIVDMIKSIPYYDLKMCDDWRNNRIIFMFYDTKYLNKNITISYNYKFNKWVSRHNYIFKHWFNYNNTLYIVDMFNTIYTNNITDNDNGKLWNNYNQYEINHSIVNKSTISIMFTTSYEIMKFLEYIKYKTYKIIFDDSAAFDNNFSPVEGHYYVYGGDIIRVYSELCDTGNINIPDKTLQDVNELNEYDKPYYRMGNWHFNYLRHNNGNDGGNLDSRIYGNWFVIQLTIIRKDNNLVEIESMDVKLNTDIV